MAVNRVSVGKRARKKGGTAKKDLPGLPTVPTEPEDDVRKYVVMLYGQAGIGKTSAAAEWPGALFLATEPGTKGLKRYEYNADGGGVTSWELFRAAIDLLIEDGGKQFKTAVIDTFDGAYDLCMDYTCRNLGIPAISEDRHGKQDRSGKGWTALRHEFHGQIERLQQAGIGLVLTSHQKIVSVEAASGAEYDFIQPSCSGQALGVARKVTDVILYCEYVREFAWEGQEIDRLMITQGDELVLAKARGPHWPKYLPMPPGGVFETIKAAFAGEHPGLPAREIMADKRTAEGSAKEIGKDKAKGKQQQTSQSRKSGAGKKKLGNRASK